ncbi:SDR family oxidoreductase [Halorussus salinisoli]|uniref:SDR family oxidoreductase n=1 Tax=Halorussus salinisoli TaxID=2558242 RepID=UPI0010C1C2DE|nr:SDR family NAD(P)-dependent oxidoreductase [Halorussus salinisoli]
MNVTDRVAVVTGVTSGVGEATAKALRREGCAVVLVARREDRLERIANEIDDGETLVVPTDVTDEDEVTATVEETMEEFGRIDILVHNAGVLRPDPVTDADRADFRKQDQVNLRGVTNTTHAALPAVLASDGGDVVAVSSMNARRNVRESRRRPVSLSTVEREHVLPAPLKGRIKDAQTRIPTNYLAAV